MPFQSATKSHPNGLVFLVIKLLLLLQRLVCKFMEEIEKVSLASHSYSLLVDGNIV